PLARFTLFELGPDRAVLLFVAHHLVFDGQSKDVLARDLAAGYNGRSLDRLPEVPLPEPDFTAARAFWAQRKHSAGDVLLPGLRRAERGGGDSVELAVEVPELPGATRFEVLLAALQALL